MQGKVKHSCAAASACLCVIASLLSWRMELFLEVQSHRLILAIAQLQHDPEQSLH